MGEPVRIGDLPVVTFGGRRGFPVPSLVQRFISDGSSVRVDVFGAFVERALEEL